MESNRFTPYDKEYMKMAMLKHEETFREQVYELHRLYQIQKKLMREILASSTENANQIEEHRGEEEVLDESSLELTLGPPSSFRERRISDENTMNSDSAPTFSSSSSGSSHIMRMNPRNFHQQRPTERTSTTEGSKQKWGVESNPSFLSGRRSRDEAEEEFRQDKLKQSPWLFQVLSLNMT